MRGGEEVERMRGRGGSVASEREREEARRLDEKKEGKGGKEVKKRMKRKSEVK